MALGCAHRVPQSRSGTVMCSGARGEEYRLGPGSGTGLLRATQWQREQAGRRGQHRFGLLRIDDTQQAEAMLHALPGVRAQDARHDGCTRPPSGPMPQRGGGRVVMAASGLDPHRPDNGPSGRGYEPPLRLARCVGGVHPAY